MNPSIGSASMIHLLRRVVVKPPEAAYQSQEQIDREWRPLGYSTAPHLEQAIYEHRSLVSLLERQGVEVLKLPSDSHTGLDSIYAHDPFFVIEEGAIVLNMAKPARRNEMRSVASALRTWGIPIIAELRDEQHVEGGDLIWLDDKTLIVGRGYRTNAKGVSALIQILKPRGISVVEVHLPHWHGSNEVLHLGTFMSLLDENLAVAYMPLVPVPLIELFAERGIELVPVPYEEHLTQGSNILAIAPRHVIMVAGNPITKQLLEHTGCTIFEFDGQEICIKGMGGPTCLTRPLWRTNSPQ